MIEELISSTFFRVGAIFVLLWYFVSALLALNFTGLLLIAIPLIYVWDTSSMIDSYTKLQSMIPWKRIGMQNMQPTTQ